MQTKEYVIHSDKINNSLNIAVCSNMLINPNMSKKQLTGVLDTISEMDPTHIVIPGNLYDEKTCTIDNRKVIDFINNLTDIADTVMVKASCDMPPIDKIHIVSKEDYYQDSQTNIVGIPECSGFSKLSKEDKINYLFNYAHLSNCYKKYNILLFKDPIVAEAFNKFEEELLEHFPFDLIISGPSLDKKSLLTRILDNMDYNKTRDKKSFYKTTYSDILISSGINQIENIPEELFGNENNGTIENIRVLKR
jgi:hypothetical protein